MGTATARTARMPAWLAGIAPLVIVGVLLALFVVFNPISAMRAVPPVEALAFERTVFREDVIEVTVRNDGPDPVTIAQVLVNDSYRGFTTSQRELGRLESTTVRIPYPWEEGLPVTLGFVTSTGLVLEHEVEAAALTPEPDAATLGIYALLGLYIGVIPVAAGLLWFGSLRHASKRWLTFFLAFTVGLLLFLLVDTTAEGFALAGETASALDGLGLFWLGALLAVATLGALEASLHRRAAVVGGLVLAYLIAAGIGLHNLGEGLAVGAALATGEVALGTFLIVGFALHNTTEGLAIVSPLGTAAQRPSLWHFAALGAIAGAPAIAGALVGGVAFSPAWAAVAFGVAAGAIAQVVWQIGRGMMADRSNHASWTASGVLAGFVLMYLTGLLTA